MCGGHAWGTMEAPSNGAGQDWKGIAQQATSLPGWRESEEPFGCPVNGSVARGGAFVQQMVKRCNRPVDGKLEQEIACLRSLPPIPMSEYANYRSQVPQLEHHPGSQTDLYRPLPAHRERGTDPYVLRSTGVVLQGPVGGTHGRVAGLRPRHY